MRMEVVEAPGYPYSKLLYLQRVFDVSARLLGLTNTHGIVKLKVIKAGAGELCPDCGKVHAVSEHGSTGPHMFPGNITEVRVVDHGDGAMTQTLAHEMQHVADMIAGRLRVEVGYVIWDGKKVPNIAVLAFYESLPWEKRAREFSRRVEKEISTHERIAA